MTMDIEIPEQGDGTTPAVEPVRGVNWRKVGIFLGLTFGLTWLLDLFLFLSGGLKNPSAALLLSFQMLLPAFSALLLETFFFKDSPLYRKNNRTLSRWFVGYFFLMVLAYAAAGGYALVQPAQVQTISSLMLLPGVVGLILLVVLRLVGGKDTFTAVGMGGGKPVYWLLLGLGVVGYYGVSSLLNYVFRLGTLVDITKVLPLPAGSPAIPPAVLMASVIFNAIIVGPFLGLIVTFGEEYGWRGFLQRELNQMGRARGTLVLGVIWGVWHWPVIWMGHNYPGQPVLGSFLMVGVCIILAFFLAYAVFKSQGVWTAAYLHALNNQTAAIYLGLVVAPAAMHIAFGIGALGLVLGGLVVLLLLRDPVWKAGG